MPFGRRNPFDEVEELLERLGQQVDVEAWRVGGRVGVDVADHGDRYVVTADLPGYERDDVDVRLVAGDLYLDASRETGPTDEDATYLERGRRGGSVSRRVALPEPVDEEGITARYHRGVLTVELPKLAADEGTRIDID